MQSHEAITGTSTMRVTQDYMDKLEFCIDMGYKAYNKLIHHYTN